MSRRAQLTLCWLLGAMALAWWVGRPTPCGCEQDEFCGTTPAPVMACCHHDGSLCAVHGCQPVVECADAPAPPQLAYVLPADSEQAPRAWTRGAFPSASTRLGQVYTTPPTPPPESWL
ncbi:MAG: hypothetical protein AB7S38_10505 [Vulcanimicrobiota bacterium]